MTFNFRCGKDFLFDKNLNTFGETVLIIKFMTKIRHWNSSKIFENFSKGRSQNRKQWFSKGRSQNQKHWFSKGRSQNRKQWFSCICANDTSNLERKQLCSR